MNWLWLRLLMAVILNIGLSELPPELDLPEGEWRCISIFMNVFDVHVNRSPLAGVVADKHYVKGKFVNASLDKANRDNERLALVLDTGLAQAHKIGLVQIAGLVARRICVMWMWVIALLLARFTV